jgi:AcrR family transcriptional regulator
MPGLRGRILELAERVFAEQDFHEVRMDDVARRCGVAKGTLYLYFPSKRELYLAVRLAGVDRLRRALDGAAGATSSLERLRHTVRSLLEEASHRRRLTALLLRRETELEPHEIRQWRRRKERVSRIVQSAIEDAIAAGELRPIDPGAGQEMLFGIVRGLQNAPRGHASIERRCRSVMDLFLRGAGVARRRPGAGRRAR